MAFTVLIVILIALVFYIIGRPRYDIVAVSTLLVLVAIGAISPTDAFKGFSHNAVITVAAVLVVSAGILKTGLLDQLVGHFDNRLRSTSIKVLLLMVITAFLSSFMNNVGALALVMPLTLKIAQKSKQSPSLFLMPIATASLLGGLVTEIGTPPNLIISSYKAANGLTPYGFFDYAPVGISLALIGILFVSFIGWRLIPLRAPANHGEDPYKIEAYISEIIVPSESPFSNKSIRDLMHHIKLDINVMSIIRNQKRILAPLAQEKLEPHDLLVIKAKHEDLNTLLDKTGLKLKNISHNPKTAKDKSKQHNFEDSDQSMVEVVLKSESPLIGKTVIDLDLRNRQGINLVAISRKGTPAIYRIKDYRFQAGDVLLIQVNTQRLTTVAKRIGAIPLAHRDPNFNVSIPKWKKFASVGIFMAAILMNILAIWPIHLCFVFAAIMQVLLGVISTKELYEAIEWPIIAMLGALIPVGEALEASGAAAMIANTLYSFVQTQSPYTALALIMTVTLLLTNLINNSAATVMMAPIAIALATQMQLAIDPFLMGVCIAASSAYMTPIGHQSNTLIMGPGGYRFTDYWQLGLPVSIITILIGTPIIAFFWAF